MKPTRWVLAAALAAGLGTAAAAQTQGVSPTEVVVGSVTDLSGIFAAAGAPSINGAVLRFEQANAAGGVHGRQVRFVVEDMAYMLPRATMAYSKLVNHDRVFAMLLSLGTPHNLAGFRIMDPRGIFNVAPMTLSIEMLSEPIDNKFITFSTYHQQTTEGMRFLRETYGLERVCAIYLPTDFGLEIANATRTEAAGMGLSFVSESTHKPDELEFVGAVQKLRADGCQIVTMALGVRAGISVVATARQLGWTDVKFLATAAGFLEAVAAVPGGLTEGLYAAAGWVDLQARRADPVPARFIAEYEARFGHPATGFAMLGYAAADMFLRALEKAGPDLTQDSFRQGMFALHYHDGLLDAQIVYGPGDHQGASIVTISRVEGGSWRLLDRREAAGG